MTSEETLSILDERVTESLALLPEYVHLLHYEEVRVEDLQSLIADSRALQKLTTQNAKLIEALKRIAHYADGCPADRECFACFSARVLKEIEDEH